MPSIAECQTSNAAELQNVLTRYVDSHDGYFQAAQVVESPNLKAAFLKIAERRKTIVAHGADLIVRQGDKAEVDGSPEAAIHQGEKNWLALSRKPSTAET